MFVDEMGITVFCKRTLSSLLHAYNTSNICTQSFNYPWSLLKTMQNSMESMKVVKAKKYLEWIWGWERCCCRWRMLRRFGGIRSDLKPVFAASVQNSSLSWVVRIVTRFLDATWLLIWFCLGARWVWWWATAVFPALFPSVHVWVRSYDCDDVGVVWYSGQDSRINVRVG